jgi:hypothetical protein
MTVCKCMSTFRGPYRWWKDCRSMYKYWILRSHYWFWWIISQNSTG